MNYDEIKKIALYARSLCENDIPRIQQEVSVRNMRIIKCLMDKYKINQELATAIFKNNNDSDALKKICDEYNV